MIAVLDTSAAVRVVLNAAESAGLARSLEEVDWVQAPELIVAELANTYWKYVRAGVLTQERAEFGLRSSLGLVDEFVPMAPLCAEAFHLAVRTGQPAYDAFFLVAARRSGAILVTADEGLGRSARRLGIRRRAVR